MTAPGQLRHVAVVLAGGTGQRVGLHIPKQLVKVAGKTILEHTLDVFEDAEDIDEIILLMAPGFLAEAEAIVGSTHPKVTTVIEGGETRNDSTRIALDALGEDECNVLFHDAVRPLVDHRIISDCVAALRTYQAVDVAIPSADTIVVVDERGCIAHIPSRETLRRGQTPQAFRLSVIRRAYEIGFADPDFHATDDCGVVLRYLPDVPIFVVDGTDQNMKITQPIDIFVADKLFQLGSTIPPDPAGEPVYAERLGHATVVVLGGSYGIGADIASLARGFGAKVFAYSRSENDINVEKPEDIERALAEAHAASGRIDHVVVTAGVLRRGALHETSPEQIAEAVRINYLAPIMVARAALPYLKETHGSLLLFTSSSYTRGRAGYSLYSSAKAAVVNLTQALADEWSPQEVRVNCINPERTATPMRTNAFGAEDPSTLLTSSAVALTSVDVLVSRMTGQVIDVRRVEPQGGGITRTEREAARIAAALAAAEAPDDSDDV
jgi:ribitol-5-phosphate 2-dehydrogenase (NADP+) / D-ribitol-5-phosphate cytidylyltransferase